MKVHESSECPLHSHLPETRCQKVNTLNESAAGFDDMKLALLDAVGAMSHDICSTLMNS